MNYSELVTEVQSYVEDVFTTADINTFIKQAEQRIYNTVALPAFRKNVTGAVSSGNKYLTTPTDWMSTFSLAVVDTDGNYEYLLDKDVNFIREAYPKATDTGLPKYYAIFDENSFLLGPTPDANYTAELHYYYYPESIVTATNTWLGDNFDSVLLYGTILEAHTFMKGEADVTAEYQKRYDIALTLLKELGDGKNRRDAYRSGQMRIPLQ